MPTKKSSPTPSTPTARPKPRPPAPVEVDASRIIPSRVGPFKGGIILNGRGRCAVCNGVGDHTHTVATDDGVTEHTHRDEPVDESDTE